MLSGLERKTGVFKGGQYPIRGQGRSLVLGDSGPLQANSYGGKDGGKGHERVKKQGVTN